MKKMLRSYAVLLSAFIMIFIFASCSSATEEQMKTMDDQMKQYEQIVADCEEVFAQYPEINDDDYKQQVAKLAELLKQIKDQSVELRKTYEENKDSYDEEKANEVIASFKDQIEKGETFLTKLKDGLTQVNDLLAQQQPAQ